MTAYLGAPAVPFNAACTGCGLAWVQGEAWESGALLVCDDCGAPATVAVQPPDPFRTAFLQHRARRERANA